MRAVHAFVTNLKRRAFLTWQDELIYQQARTQLVAWSNFAVAASAQPGDGRFPASSTGKRLRRAANAAQTD